MWEPGLLCLLALIVAGLIYDFLRWIEKRKLPVSSVLVRVAHKRAVDLCTATTIEELADSDYGSEYHVIFESIHGERLDFVVSESWYKRFTKGDKGTLICRGDLIVDFLWDGSFMGQLNKTDN